MLNAYVTSALRTGSGYFVAWLLSLSFAHPLLNSLGVTTVQATRVVSGFVIFTGGTLYYLAARALERRYPKTGWLLGSPTPPSYANITAELGAPLYAPGQSQPNVPSAAPTPPSPGLGDGPITSATVPPPTP
jgi:hypothetical protein